MDNKITPEVIERFLSNQCDAREAELVASYLKNVPTEVLNQYLSDNEWQDPDSATGPHLAEELRNQNWSDLAEKTQLHKHRTKRVLLKRLMAAACMVGLLIIGYHFYASKQTDAHIEHVKSGKKENIKITKSNRTAVDQRLLLPDGTNVILKPGATVCYFQSFNKNRQLALVGKAFFSVIHDTAHPFVVTTNGISTTDLGTKFWIENKEAAQTVSVELMEGLVRVQSLEKNFGMNDIELFPGEKVVINKLTGNVAIRDVKKASGLPARAEPSVKKKKKVVAGSTTWTNAAYTFSKTSLEEVFKKLATRYKVSFVVADPEINNRQFTGKVMYSDSLKPLMEVICVINNLSYTRKGDTLYIKN